MQTTQSSQKQESTSQPGRRDTAIRQYPCHPPPPPLQKLAGLASGAPTPHFAPSSLRGGDTSSQHTQREPTHKNCDRPADAALQTWTQPSPPQKGGGAERSEAEGVEPGRSRGATAQPSVETAGVILCRQLNQVRSKNRPHSQVVATPRRRSFIPPHSILLIPIENGDTKYGHPARGNRIKPCRRFGYRWSTCQPFSSSSLGALP